MNFRGKSVEEAISKALEALGVTRDEVEITVLAEASKGILGIGSREARVDVVLKETSIAELIQETIHKEAAAEPAAKQEEAEKAPEAPEISEERAPREIRKAEPEELPAQTAAKTETALAFLKELLEKMGYQCEYFIRSEQGFTIINIRGRNASKLIGKRGEILYAMQYLVNIVANRKDESNVKILLDVEDFRKQRERTLTNLAVKLARQVRETGMPVSLEPMNPLERKIIHMALQKEPDVLTTSDGEEGRRHIVISLKAQD